MPRGIAFIFYSVLMSILMLAMAVLVIGVIGTIICRLTHKHAREADGSEHLTREEEEDARRAEDGGIDPLENPVITFERLVEDVVASLPAEVLAYIENVIIVTAYGEAESLQGVTARYSGSPRSVRSRSYSGVVPDVITVYRRSVELLSQHDEVVMRDVISRAVRHEIGHHLGLGHEQMGERVDQVKPL